MDRPGVRQVPEGSGEQGKLEKTGCTIICGAPTTLAVKGLMMMMKSLAGCTKSDTFPMVCAVKADNSSSAFEFEICMWGVNTFFHRGGGLNRFT